jgi:hypothetical protein
LVALYDAIPASLRAIGIVEGAAVIWTTFIIVFTFDDSREKATGIVARIVPQYWRVARGNRYTWKETRLSIRSDYRDVTGLRTSDTAITTHLTAAVIATIDAA